MNKIGFFILTFLILWLLLHKEKNQENYHLGIAKSASLLPQFTQHFIGLD